MSSQLCTIASSPMRASFVGGGTDLPEYYERFDGLAVGVAIKTYNLVQLISQHMHSEPWRLCSTRGSSPDISAGGIRIINAVLEKYQLGATYSAFSHTDLTELGSGLGSSSSLAVAAVSAASSCKNKPVSKNELAEEAYYIERNIVGSPVGKQDHYMAACGGLNLYEFSRNGNVNVHPLSISGEGLAEFQQWLTVIQLPRMVSANSILAVQSMTVKKSETAMNSQHEIKRLVEPFVTAIQNSHFSAAAGILDKAWRIKQKLNSKISHSSISELYERALVAGALGGKLLGAGGGGHMLLMIPPDLKTTVRRALSEYNLMDVHFDYEGAKIIHAS